MQKFVMVSNYLNLVHYYKEPERGRQLIEEAEVVLFGGTDDESYIQERLQQKKTVIRYSERMYKEAQWKAISPRGLHKKYLDHTRYRKDPVYLLCAGAYVPSDFHIVRAYPGKMLKWGYFPEKKVYSVEQLMDAKEPARILWAARMIDWKHPELPLRMAKSLKEQGIPFHLEMIGGGELEPEGIPAGGGSKSSGIPGTCRSQKSHGVGGYLSCDQRPQGRLGSCGE